MLNVDAKGEANFRNSYANHKQIKFVTQTFRFRGEPTQPPSTVQVLKTLLLREQLKLFQYQLIPSCPRRIPTPPTFHLDQY